MASIKFIFIGLFLWSCNVFADQVFLTNLKIKNDAHALAVTFYLSGNTRYRTFSLKNPDRFTIDFENTALRSQMPSFSEQVFSGAAIRDLRYAQQSNGAFRFVFDLSHRATPQIMVANADIAGERKLELLFPKATIASIPKVDLNTLVHSFATNDNTNKNMHYRNVTIVIDPGHGGKDPGAIGAAGHHEKNIVLAISKILAHDINQQKGFHAILTRTGDYYLPLRERLALARKYKADMFIAIHADAFRHRHASGVSVYALSQRGATSEAARWLAKRENASELMGGVDLYDQSHLLRSVLINLSQSATIRASLRIGDDVMSAMQSFAKLHHNRVEQAAFVVLKSPDIPSLLIETGFISNPNEERRLRSYAYQQKLARAMMRGVRQYFSYFPPRDTWLSVWRQHKVG